MNVMKNIRRVAGIGMTVAVVAFGFTVVASHYSQAQVQENTGRIKKKDKKGSGRKTRRVQTLSKKVFEHLNKAQEFMELEDYASALATVDEAQQIRRLKPYDQAMIYQLYAYIYSTQEKYEEAAEKFKALLTVDKDAMPEGIRTTTIYNLAQISMVLEKWAEGVDYLNQWFEVAENPQPTAYILLAQGYAQIKEWKKALAPVRKAIDLTKARGKAPKENWYQLLLAANFELNDFKAVRDVLEILVDKFPKKNYWLQLAAVYGELNDEFNQLNVMELAYRQGYLNRSTEYVNMAQLYMYHDIPFKGAVILEKALEDGTVKADTKNWELLANAFANADEVDRAIPYLEKAAGLSDKGELYVRLGQAYMQREEWKKSAKAFGDAIKKGGLKKQDTAYLLQGMARFNGNNIKGARSSFTAARKSKNKDTAKNARAWIRHIDREEKRKRNQ